MKKKITVLSIAFSTLVGLNNFTNAQCSLDQNQPTNNSGTSERNLPGYYDWQSFTSGETGPLCQVDVLFCNTNTLLVGTGTLNIYSGTGIGGTLLASQDVNVDGSTTAMNTRFWGNFSISNPPSISVGQVYTWQFIPTQGGGLTDPYLIQLNIPDVYAGGVSYGFGTGGDLAFATYVDVATGINKITTENNFVVYPNPASDLITVNGITGFVATPVIIYDQLGRIVFTGKLTAESSTIDIHKLSKGIYFLKAGEQNQQMIVKL